MGSAACGLGQSASGFSRGKAPSAFCFLMSLRQLNTLKFIFTVVCCYHITYTFQSDSILAGADLEYMVTNFCKIHTIILQLLLLFLLLLLLLLLSLLSLLLK